MSELKETTYGVLIAFGEKVPTYYKVRGMAWTRIEDAPAALRHQLSDWRKCRYERCRFRKFGVQLYFYGEVTIRVPYSRMGAYLRRKKSESA
jgi:hypothetical protein